MGGDGEGPIPTRSPSYALRSNTPHLVTRCVLHPPTANPCAEFVRTRRRRVPGDIGVPLPCWACYAAAAPRAQGSPSIGLRSPPARARPQQSVGLGAVNAGAASMGVLAQHHGTCVAKPVWTTSSA